MYRKLKRTWSHGFANHIPGFKGIFPELSHLKSEELYERMEDLNLEFYYEKRTPVNFWNRLTLPFAVILWFLMLMCIPLNFVVTGHWGYSLGKKNWILNWFRSLGLM